MVDSYGAIHHAEVRFGDEWTKTHEALWPNITHKRWRFDLHEWNLEKSVLSKGDMTEAEQEDVVAYVRKRYEPPFWVLKGEEWDALGRPRSGKAYDRWEKKWDVYLKRLQRKRSA